MFENAKLKPVVVLFTGQGSDGNKRALRIWDKVSARFEENRKVILASFSCNGMRDFCWRLNVKRIPAIECHFGDDIIVPFDGTLSSEGVMKWIEQMMEKPVFNMSTYERRNNCVSFIMSRNDTGEFKKAAFAFKNTTNRFYQGNMSNELIAIYDHDFNITNMGQSVEDFVWRNQFPLIQELAYKQFVVRKQTRRFFAITILDMVNGEQLRVFPDTLDLLRNVAKKNFYDMGITWIDSRSMQRDLGRYGITTFPSMLVLDNTIGKEYFFVKHDIDGLTDWFEQIRNGEIQPDEIPWLSRFMTYMRFLLVRHTIVIVLCVFLLIIFAILICYLIREIREVRRRDMRIRYERKRH